MPLSAVTTSTSGPTALVGVVEDLRDLAVERADLVHDERAEDEDDREQENRSAEAVRRAGARSGRARRTTDPAEVQRTRRERADGPHAREHEGGDENVELSSGVMRSENPRTPAPISTNTTVTSCRRRNSAGSAGGRAAPAARARDAGADFRGRGSPRVNPRSGGRPRGRAVRSPGRASGRAERRP